jgi:hypothetical protein
VKKIPLPHASHRPIRRAAMSPPATRRKTDNDAHRPRRIGLRPRDARGGRESGSARCQMQELMTEKFHNLPPPSNIRGPGCQRPPTKSRCCNSRILSPAVGTHAALKGDLRHVPRAALKKIYNDCRCPWKRDRAGVRSQPVAGVATALQHSRPCCVARG